MFDLISLIPFALLGLGLLLIVLSYSVSDFEQDIDYQMYFLAHFLMLGGISIALTGGGMLFWTADVSAWVQVAFDQFGEAVPFLKFFFTLVGVVVLVVLLEWFKEEIRYALRVGSVVIGIIIILYNLTQ